MLRSLNIVRGALKSNVRFIPAKTSYNVLYPLHRSTINNNSLILSKSLHVQTVVCNRHDPESIDRTLLRLDGEIRKTGRINRREIEEILSDIREMKKATSSQSLMIIRCCGELVPEETPENRAKLVHEVWKTMESLNVPVDISHYNALLKVYLENEYKFSPTEFLQDLSNKGVEPNRVTYQRLIARFCQEGDIDGASTILQHMKDKQLPINEHVFNALVHGHAQANDMESAEGIISVMKQAGLEPSDDTYTALVLGYAKNGDMGNVHRTIKDCNDKEVFLIDRDFLSIMYTLAVNNHDSKIDEVVPYLRKHSGFNQEAVNVILRLVNKGKLEVAYKIFEMMPRGVRDEEYAPSGGFFVNQLVRSAAVSSSDVVKYCLRLQEAGWNKHALVKATERSMMTRNFEKASDLLEALKENGFPIRQHYFWPFFAGNPTEKEVYEGLKCMMCLEVYPQQETLREYIVPAVLKAKRGTEPFEVTLEKLSAFSRVPMPYIFSCAVNFLLSKDDLTTAAKYALRYRSNFSTPQLRKPLIEAYHRKHDTKNVVRLLASVATKTDEGDVRETVGHFLVELLDSTNPAERGTVLGPLLKELLSSGLGISNSAAELIQNSLGEALTPDLTNKISKMTSGDLVRKIESYSDARREESLDTRTVEELETLLEDSVKNGKPHRSLQKTLIYQYYAAGNVEKAHKLYNEMKADGFIFGAGLETKLCMLYCENGMVSEAKELLSKLEENHLGYKLDGMTLVKYAHALAATGDYEGALNFVKTQPMNEDNRKMPLFSQNTASWKLLNVYAEAGKLEDTKAILEILQERNLVNVNTLILGSLIKAHLVKDDLVGALAEFEQCAEKYQVTPMKQELFCRFIKAEDADRLQKVLDIGSTVHGEVNCLYDLVFAFMECGKVRQAKKILDTPGLRARNEKLEYICQKYLEAGRVSDLEKLVEITKDIFGVDRSSLYFYLLKAYCKVEDTDKALSVWTSLQEESIQPTPELLDYLADFLRKRGKPIPFIRPQYTSKKAKTSKPTTDTSTSISETPNKPDKPNAVSNPELQNFRKAIELKDLDLALRLRQQLESADANVDRRERPLNINDYSSLLDLMLETKETRKALRLVEDMNTRGSHPNVSSLKKLADALAADGDIDSLKRLDELLPRGIRSSVRLDTRIMFACLNRNLGHEYFNENIRKPIEEGVNTSTSPNLKVPNIGFTRVLCHHEDLLPEYERLASIADGKTAQLLNNSIWCYYFIKKDFDKARQFRNDKQLKAEEITVSPICSRIREDSDFELLQNLQDFVKSIPNFNEIAKGHTVSIEIEMLIRRGDFEKALELYKTVSETMPSVDVNRQALLKLKSELEAKNKEFPFDLTSKRTLRNKRQRQSNEAT